MSANDDELGVRSASPLRRRAFLGGMAALGAYAAGGTALGSVLTGCSKGSSSPSSPSSTSARTLSAGVFQNPDSLDPAVTGLITATQILGSMFDPLMWKFAGNDTAYPGLADRYTVSPDAMTYTFYLKTNVKFHDGTPLTAEAVKATFDHIVNPATKSRSAIGSLGPYKETRILGTHVAQVVFSKANAAFANEMTDITLGISSPTALAKYGQNYASHPTGTGPFMFSEFLSGDRVVVTRNPSYNWAPPILAAGPAKLQSITFRVLSDPTSQNDALQTGEIQIAQNLNPGDVVTAVSAGKRKLTSFSRGMPYCIIINTAKPPTDELAVRQALIYATNTQAVIQTLFQGLYQPANSVLTPVTPGYSPSQAMYSYNPAKAEKLLDTAGWTKSGGGRSKNGQQLTLQFINIADFGFDTISQLLQAQWRAIGINSVITDQAFPSVATTYNQGKHNLADWFYYDVDPFLLATVFGSTQIASGFNWAHYDNPSLDAAIAAANAEVNTATRIGMYQSVGHTLMSDAVLVPIYNLESILVTAPSVSGIKFGATAQPLYHAVTV